MTDARESLAGKCEDMAQRGIFVRDDFGKANALAIAAFFTERMPTSQDIYRLLIKHRWPSKQADAILALITSRMTA